MKRAFVLLLGMLMSCATSADAKIEATLRAALDDPSSVTRPLTFEIEKAPDGTIIVPLFIRSTDPDRTAAAVKAVSGSTSTITKNVVVARLPMKKIRTIAARSEVLAIEPSFLSR